MRERAKRVHHSIVLLRDEIEAMKQALPRDNPDVSQPILLRLNPLLSLLTAGMQRYDREATAS